MKLLRFGPRGTERPGILDPARQFGRNPWRAGVNLGADMVRDQANDPLTVGG